MVAALMGADCTQVRESRLQERINHRVFAGAKPLAVGAWREGEEGVMSRLLAFPAGVRFAFDRWDANRHGSVGWRVLVCETLAPGEWGDCVPDVRPMVRVLADVKGATRAQAFMAWLQARQDDIERPSELEWARVHLYFNRMPLVRLRGVQSVALSVSDDG